MKLNKNGHTYHHADLFCTIFKEKKTFIWVVNLAAFEENLWKNNL